MTAKRFAFHLDLLETPSANSHVFSDPRNIRRRRMRRRFAVLLSALVVWMSFFLSGAQPLGSNATMSNLRVDSLAEQPLTPVQYASDQILALDVPAPDACTPTKPPMAAMAADTGTARVFAHLPASLEWAHLSLDKSCDVIAVLGGLDHTGRNRHGARCDTGRSGDAPARARLSGRRRQAAGHAAPFDRHAHV